MVKFIFSLSIILMCSHQVGARTVEQVEIKEVGINSRAVKNPNEIDMCKDFRPTREQIINYFNSARELNENETLLHEYYFPCIAKGNVNLDENIKGEWTLQSSGLAYILTDKKKNIVFFLKDNQWEDPYACMYGLSGEDSC
ncbi:hypothetical protein ACFL9S_06610 [Erwinia sp. AnSW2-5]|uniref:hypothetical protein n=1 Tax=Erwinia sp. AnSW2-5 TaxID=3367692 RepID=UPI00385E695C